MEQPAALILEREGTQYPPQPIESGQLLDRIERVSACLVVQTKVYRAMVEACLQCGPNAIELVPIPGAFEGIRYLNGNYKCDKDEAIVLEFEEPKAPYWGFQLVNLQWEATDYWMRQTSINGRQATVDMDGCVRLVIAHRDPGIPNWLDAAGQTVGLLSGRCYKPEAVTVPRLNRVALATLRALLPRETPVVTPAERSRALRQRMLSAHARQCGDQ